MAIIKDKLSNRDITTTIDGGYVYINMPDPTQASGYRTKQVLLEDHIIKSVEFYADYASLPATGNAEIIYITLDDYSLYIWDSGSYQSVGGGGGGGHVIQEEGTPLTNRANLNFVGDAVTATDDAGNNATKITITQPDITGLLDETAHDLLDHTGLTGIPSIAGLLDETAHDALDHTGLTGVGNMFLATEQSVTALKTFDKDKIATKGTSTGKVIISNANTGASDFTATLQAVTGTIALTSDIPIATQFDATIGSGGQYADITAAQAAGKYRLKAVGNITVSGDTTISNAIYLDLNTYTMACGTYNFTINSGKKIEIFNGIITFGYGSQKTLFISAAANNYDLWISRCTITNSSTVNECIIACYGNINDCIINCSNTRYAAFGTSTGGLHWQGIIRNTNIVGGGSSCRDAIWNNLSTSTDVGDNIIFSGTFASNVVMAQSLNGKYSNITYTGSNTVYLTMCRLDGLTDAGNKVYVDMYQGVKNSIIQNSRFGYVLTFRANSKFSNCYIHNNATLLNGTPNTDSNLTYDLCEFNGTLSATGHKNKLSACLITGTSSISSDYNIFIQCTFTGAVTLNSGAEYNIFIGCIFTGGLTDSSGNSTNIIKDNI